MEEAGPRPANGVEGKSLEDSDHRYRDRKQAMGVRKMHKIPGDIRNDPERHRGDGQADERDAQDVVKPGCRACPRLDGDAVPPRRSHGNDRDQEEETEDPQIRVRPPRPQGCEEERGGNPGCSYPDNESCIRGVPADRAARRFR